MTLTNKKVEICLSPELLHLYDIKDKIVVIVDIFRATSTMVTALAQGVQSIKPVADLETCRALSSFGYVLAGERDGKKEEGFELGNSPLAYLGNKYKGNRIAMTTTNGTVAIEKSRYKSSEVVLGAFLNLQITATYLIEKTNDVLILCAGWKGKFNLEDSLFAGALVSHMEGHYRIECDAAIANKNLFENNINQLKKFLSQASHAKRLQNQNIEADIDFCLQVDRYPIVVNLKGDELVIQNQFVS